MKILILKWWNLKQETSLWKQWGWAHVYGVDGNPSCKIPANSANSPPRPPPLAPWFLQAGAALAHGTAHPSPTLSLGSSVGRKVSITKYSWRLSCCCTWDGRIGLFIPRELYFFLRKKTSTTTGIVTRFFSCTSQNRKNVSELRAPEIASNHPTERCSGFPCEAYSSTGQWVFSRGILHRIGVKSSQWVYPHKWFFYRKGPGMMKTKAYHFKWFLVRRVQKTEVFCLGSTGGIYVECH